MKKISITLIALMVLLFSSCSTRKFIIEGTPGTVITKGNGKQLGIIGSNGQTKVKLGYDFRYDQGFVPYLLSRHPDNPKEAVPFALDFKTEKYVLKHLLWAPTIYGYEVVVCSDGTMQKCYKYTTQTTNHDLVQPNSNAK